MAHAPKVQIIVDLNAKALVCVVPLSTKYILTHNEVAVIIDQDVYDNMDVAALNDLVNRYIDKLVIK